MYSVIQEVLSEEVFSTIGCAVHEMCIRDSSNSFNVNLGYDFITDMLVLEFTIDDKIIDAHRNDNPWLSRAAQSLARCV